MRVIELKLEWWNRWVQFSFQSDKIHAQVLIDYALPVSWASRSLVLDSSQMPQSPWWQSPGSLTRGQVQRSSTSLNTLCRKGCFQSCYRISQDDSAALIIPKEMHSDPDSSHYFGIQTKSRISKTRDIQFPSGIPKDQVTLKKVWWN